MVPSPTSPSCLISHHILLAFLSVSLLHRELPEHCVPVSGILHFSCGSAPSPDTRCCPVPSASLCLFLLGFCTFCRRPGCIRCPTLLSPSFDHLSKACFPNDIPTLLSPELSIGYPQTLPRFSLPSIHISSSASSTCPPCSFPFPLQSFPPFPIRPFSIFGFTSPPQGSASKLFPLWIQSLCRSALHLRFRCLPKFPLLGCSSTIAFLAVICNKQWQTRLLHRITLIT